MSEQVRRRVNRVVAVLAVLLGVVAMHGLADGQHHSASASPAAAAPAHGAHGSGGPVTVAADVATVRAPAPAGCGDSCPMGGPGLLALCVAVLAFAVALALKQGRRHGWSDRAGRLACALRPTRTAPRRRLDVVAELGICRT